MPLGLLRSPLPRECKDDATSFSTIITLARADCPLISLRAEVKSRTLKGGKLFNILEVFHDRVWLPDKGVLQ